MAESSRMVEDDGNSAEVRVGDESVKIVKEISSPWVISPYRLASVQLSLSIFQPEKKNKCLS